MYTIAGPFELVQGGTGALLFDPIYTYSEKGERSFWGFSILVLQWDNFIEEVELDKMEDAGYRYQIWKKDPYTGEKIVTRRAKRIFTATRWKLRAASPTIHGILRSSRRPGGSRTSSSRWASSSPPSLA